MGGHYGKVAQPAKSQQARRGEQHPPTGDGGCLNATFEWIRHESCSVAEIGM